MSKTPRNHPQEAGKSASASFDRSDDAQRDERGHADGTSITLPAHIAGSGTLDRLVDQARDYAAKATAENTNKAYATDWKHFARWCRRHGTDPLGGGDRHDGIEPCEGGRPSAPCPDPQLIGLYLSELAMPTDGAPSLSVATIERRLSGLAWNYTQRGFTLDRKDRHIASVLAGIKRKHARPPVQKEAILLIGYAGGLRRSEIVSLDFGKDDTPEAGGWIEVMEEGAVLTLNAKTGWREVEIGRGSSDETCPVHALEQYLHFAKIDFGPVFVRTTRDGTKTMEHRLSDKHVARLIKQTVLDAGIRAELPEKDRLALFSGHSLRAGLASSAEVDERYVQKQLGHASAEMTRRYQRRRDRFRVNLTKAVGL